MGLYDIYKAQLLSGNSGSSGGDTATLDELIDRSITEFSSNVTSVGNSAFSGCKILTTVNFPNVTSIDASAFANCYKLTNVCFPNVTSIGDSAFTNCKILTTVNFPNVTSIGTSAFTSCYKLINIDFPKATSIKASAFYYCESFTNVCFPNVTSIGNSAFQKCTSLTNIDLPNVTSIGAYVFQSCPNLKIIIIRSTDICKLGHNNSLSDSLIANKTGYIYVPSALVSSYKTASSWSTYATQFRALEDYTVDGTTTGELDETKI